MVYYRINEIKLKIGEPETAIPAKIVKRLGRKGRGLKVTDYRIVKKSIDARNKQEILLVYSVDFAARYHESDGYVHEAKLELPVIEKAEYELPMSGNESLSGRPVVCGFGPCGMFAGLILALAGYRPVILERGSKVEKRVADVEKFLETGCLNTESNVQFGEGGAGTFSDGKLTTNIKDPRIAKVLDEFVMAGASEEILYKNKPHIGTDVLRVVVKNIREKIISLGGEIHFDTKLTAIESKAFSEAEGKVLKTIEEKAAMGEENCENRSARTLSMVKAVNTESGEELSFETNCLILAIGHSARDTFKVIYDNGISMQQKPFSIGLRIRHPQDLINRAQYGDGYEAYGLPPAEYKLSYHCREDGKAPGRGVYTFCMCPGGEVINSSSEEGGVVTNGMSYSKRDGEFANSALLVDVRTSDFPSEHPLAGVEFQRKYERLAFENGGGNYRNPECSLGDFRRYLKFSGSGNKVEDKETEDKEIKDNEAGNKAGRVARSLPEFALDAMEEAIPAMARKLKGFDSPDAMLFAVESRSSSPVRILRDEDYVSSMDGVYPSGEGAGYAGGIVSAAVDGIKAAEAVIKRFKR